MWVRFILLGDREEQKKHHRNLREAIKSLLDEKDVSGFVMTYHEANFYLCLDVPSLDSCSMDSLRGRPRLKQAIDYVESSCRYEGPDDYLNAVRASIAKILADHGRRSSGEEIALLADTQIDSASRGCRIALRILSNEIPVNFNPCSFYERVERECIPLNDCFPLSSSSHFCFNSLGFFNQEETALKYLCTATHSMSEAERLTAKTVSEKALKRLRNREPHLGS